MKVFVCLLAIVSVCSASVLAPHHVVAAPLLSTGSSTQSRTQDALGQYSFAYNEQHATGGSSRQESGAPGVATGSYTLNVADGRQRVVNYVADGLGFRAAIATNEPGTAAQPAASTAISSPHAAPLPVAPIHPVPVHAPVVTAPVVHSAPVLAHPVAAPVVHSAPVLAAPVAVAHHVPAISTYSTSVNHVSAPAVLHHAAPVLAHPAPVAVAHGPLLAPHHLAAPLAHYRK